MVDFNIIKNKIIKALAEESSLYITKRFNKNCRKYKCSVNKCLNKAYAKGLCNAHYIRKRNGKDSSVLVKNRSKGENCIDCGCKISFKGGFHRCAKHYKTRRLNIIKKICVEMLGGKCKRCENKFPLFVYDFHHNDRSEKLLAISASFNKSSIEKIAKEVSKCTIYCANCHRIIHLGEKYE
jgi:hypothetical protein